MLLFSVHRWLIWSTKRLTDFSNSQSKSRHKVRSCRILDCWFIQGSTLWTNALLNKLLLIIIFWVMPFVICPNILLMTQLSLSKKMKLSELSKYYNSLDHYSWKIKGKIPGCFILVTLLKYMNIFKNNSLFSPISKINTTFNVPSISKSSNISEKIRHIFIYCC